MAGTTRTNVWPLPFGAPTVKPGSPDPPAQHRFTLPGAQAEHLTSEQHAAEQPEERMDGRSQHLLGGLWLCSLAEALSIPGGTRG